MIKLHDKETGALVGELTEDQFDFLQDQLEEESWFFGNRCEGPQHLVLSMCIGLMTF